jgi:hypothetical protein
MRGPEDLTAGRPAAILNSRFRAAISTDLMGRARRSTAIDEDLSKSRARD